MKKAAALCLIILLAITGCAKGAGARELGALYREAQGLTATARVGILSDNVAMTYLVEYRWSPQAATVTLLEPQPLAGISAKLGGAGSAAIDYQGASVEALLPGIPGFSPIDSLHGAFADLRDALHETEAPVTRDGLDCLLVTYTAQEAAGALEKQLWLERETGALRHAEFFVDGRLVMSLDVESMSLF